MQDAETEEHRADRQPQNTDAVANQQTVQRVLEAGETGLDEGHPCFSVTSTPWVTIAAALRG